MASIAAIAALMRFQAVFCVCNCSTPVIMCAVSLFWLLGPVEGVRVKGYRRKNSPHPDLFDGPVVDEMNDISPYFACYWGVGVQAVWWRFCWVGMCPARNSCELHRRAVAIVAGLWWSD